MTFDKLEQPNAVYPGGVHDNDVSVKLLESAQVGAAFGVLPGKQYNDTYQGIKDFWQDDLSKTRAADAFPSQQALSQAKSVEQPHNYIGGTISMAVDVGNGMINEVFNPQLPLTFIESAAGGYALRCAPRPVQAGILIAGAVMGIDGVARNAPTWVHDASTVINESTHTAQERAHAHVGLEHIGGGIVELGVGLSAFRSGFAAPEEYAAGRSVLTKYNNGELKLSKVLPQFNEESATLVQNSKLEPPTWVTDSTEAVKSKIGGIGTQATEAVSKFGGMGTQASEALTAQVARFRSWLKPNPVEAGVPETVAPASFDGKAIPAAHEPLVVEAIDHPGASGLGAHGQDAGGFAVIKGGGPGIMEAGDTGAGIHLSGTSPGGIGFDAANSTPGTSASQIADKYIRRDGSAPTVVDADPGTSASQIADKYIRRDGSAPTVVDADPGTSASQMADKYIRRDGSAPADEATPGAAGIGVDAANFTPRVKPFAVRTAKEGTPDLFAHGNVLETPVDDFPSKS